MRILGLALLVLIAGAASAAAGCYQLPGDFLEMQMVDGKTVQIANNNFKPMAIIALACQLPKDAKIDWPKSGRVCDGDTIMVSGKSCGVAAVTPGAKP